MFTLAEKRRRAPATSTSSEAGDASPEVMVWQGTVAVTGPGAGDIVLLQLVTAAVDLADSHRDVLLGVAHTLTFTDPAIADSVGHGSGVLDAAESDAIRNDFG